MGAHSSNGCWLWCHIGLHWCVHYCWVASRSTHNSHSPASRQQSRNRHGDSACAQQSPLPRHAGELRWQCHSASVSGVCLDDGSEREQFLLGGAGGSPMGLRKWLPRLLFPRLGFGNWWWPAGAARLLSVCLSVAVCLSACLSFCIS